MFDSVGRSQKQSAGQNLVSLILTGLLSGGSLGAAIWAGKQVVDEVLEEAPVEVTFIAEAAPPPPPPPPPPAGGGKPKTEKKEKKPDEPKPDPVEVEPEPVDLEPEPEPQDEPEAEADGVAGGVEGGVEGGVGGGVVGGQIGGVIGGQLGGTGTAVSTHYSKIKVKRQVAPRFPEAAKQLGFDNELCLATVIIDEKGKPTSVSVSKCPAVFHEELKEAMMKWQFYPYKTGGTAMSATFTQPIRFVLTN